MKRLLAISLLCVYLLAGTELRQLLKVPVLVEHYREHQQQNQQLSFLGFIYMHYAGDDANDQDQDRDMQLPFKSSEFSGSTGLDLIPLLDIRLNLVSSLENIPLTFYRQEFLSAYFASIWQPPKISLA